MEMLIASALFVVVLAVVLPFFPLGERSWETEAAKVELQQHGRIAMEEIQHELLYAYQVSCDPAKGIITYYKKISGNLKRYRIYLWGQQLLLDLPEGTAVPLASYVDSFSLAPAGKLQAGQAVIVLLTFSLAEEQITFRSSIMPKNLAVEV
ncbi:MAG: hypothetical protein GX357_09960 [Firmicutes bacterium]|nr:hypothetical protein [Bacillota bacterium]